MNGYEFSLTTGNVDHSLSDYYREIDGVPAAYERLWSEIGTSQIVWCYTLANQYSTTGIARLEWELEIPTDDVLGFVDDIVWNRVLGIQCDLPEELRIEFKNAAIPEHPDDPAARMAFEKELAAEFWNRQPPEGDWWASLLVEARADDCTSALVAHPVDDAMVIDKQLKVART